MMRNISSYLYGYVYAFISWLNVLVPFSRPLEWKAKGKPSIVYKPVVDPIEAYKLQINCFLPDECESLEKLKKCHKEAPWLFYGAYINEEDNERRDRLIGYICGTLTNDQRITKQTTNTHDPTGRTIYIQLICIEKQYRAQGVGDRIIYNYLDRVRTFNREYKSATGSATNRYDILSFLSRDNMISYYKRYNAKYIGPSDVVVGK
ncbi:hypothetical protein BDF22DRAFT_670179 [Syncephalis plumigaleata]|nr:hypothetical protein BDF22DRAFT_670179 [Syncephalis plumigaleata]